MVGYWASADHEIERAPVHTADQTRVHVMEDIGIEPMTFALPARRSPS